MFLILKAEMVKRGVSTMDIASFMNLSDRSIRSRLNGTISWRWPEMRMLRNHFFEGCEIEYLFSDDPAQPNRNQKCS